MKNYAHSVVNCAGTSPKKKFSINNIRLSHAKQYSVLIFDETM